MRVLACTNCRYPNNYNNKIRKPAEQTFRGVTYTPPDKFSFSNFNPIILYMNKLFGKSLELARRRIHKVSEYLEPRLWEVPIGKTYAWDINGEDRQKYVIVLHGTGQNITNLQHLYEAILQNTSYAVLAPEFQGFGKNQSAKIGPKTFLEDSVAAFEYLNSQGIPARNITILGHSLGGFAAAQLAEKYPNAERLIMVSSIDKLSESLNSQGTIKKRFPPFIAFLFKTFSFLKSPLDNLFRTHDCLKKLEMPVDIIHSKRDTLVSSTASESLAQYCKNLHSLKFLDDNYHGIDATKVSEIVSILRG